MSAESLDKLMYSFVVEDVLQGLFIKVPPGYVACVYDLGRGVLKKVLTPGLHLKIPFWQKAKLFNTQTLEYEISHEFNPSHERAMGDVPVAVVTRDGINVAVQGTVLLRLSIQKIPSIWQTIGEDFVVKIVRPTIRSRVRMVMSGFDYDDIVGAKRRQTEEKLKEELDHIFAERGIVVENVLLSDVTVGAGGHAGRSNHGHADEGHDSGHDDHGHGGHH